MPRKLRSMTVGAGSSTGRLLDPVAVAEERVRGRVREQERVLDAVWSYLQPRLGQIRIDEALRELPAADVTLDRDGVTEAIYDSLDGTRLLVAADGTLIAAPQGFDAQER